MRLVTLELPEEVAHRLEILSARDDDSLKTGIERFLTELVAAKQANRMPNLVYVDHHKTIVMQFGTSEGVK